MVAACLVSLIFNFKKGLMGVIHSRRQLSSLDLQHIDGIHNSVEIAIKKYSSHPSVKLMSSNTKSSHTFFFNFVATSKASTELCDLKVKKACNLDSISSKVFRDNLGIFTDILQQYFNTSIDDEIFPNELKKGEVTLVFNADDQMIKSNYRPITALSAAAKVYERLMSEQMAAYSETFLSLYLCGFRKGYST